MKIISVATRFVFFLHGFLEFGFKKKVLYNYLVEILKGLMVESPGIAVDKASGIWKYYIFRSDFQYTMILETELRNLLNYLNHIDSVVSIVNHVVF